MALRVDCRPCACTGSWFGDSPQCPDGSHLCEGSDTRRLLLSRFETGGCDGGSGPLASMGCGRDSNTGMICSRTVPSIWTAGWRCIGSEISEFVKVNTPVYCWVRGFQTTSTGPRATGADGSRDCGSCEYSRAVDLVLRACHFWHL